MGIVIFWIMMGGVIAIVAKNKGLDVIPWFIYGAFIWPVALVHVLVTKANEQTVERSAILSGESKKCPQCAELVKRDARVCRFCRYEFPESPPASAPFLHPSGGTKAKSPLGRYYGSGGPTQL